MAANEIHAGDEGALFTFTVEDENGDPVDLSHATLTQFVFQKPDSSVLTVNATLTTDGTDGSLKYATSADDLDQTGTWRYQVFVELPNVALHSDVGKFKVFPNLPL